MMYKKILIIGATGYVGGRLIARLLDAGYQVRAMARSLEKMASRQWACDQRVELFSGDVQDPQSLEQATKRCSAAYYLVHSMISEKKNYAEADRTSALNMKNAAEANNLEQIIYLGGLGNIHHPNLSRHLASRHEVGQILQSGLVPTTVLRAAMILGSGSASFEILRYLTERLPLMITPKWVYTPTQPIAIANVLDYLLGALGQRQTYGCTFDIGGPDVLNYHDLIDIYTKTAKLPKRRIFPVPVLTPKLSAYWIHLVTPVPSSIAQPLTEGLAVPTRCGDNSIQKIIPVRLSSCREAIATALDQILEQQIDTCWSDAGSMHPPEWAACGDADYAGGTVLTCGYGVRIPAPAENIWRLVSCLGGHNGYYFGDLLWRLRGALDRLAGGVGLRRGRKHPIQLQTGDALDFWRIISVRQKKRLSLLAEMKLPGEAILDLQIHSIDDEETELRMISRFLPRGIIGILYWYILFPFHVIIFKGMLKEIARRASPSALTSIHKWQPRQPRKCSMKDL
jgi:uncharacterized protein YbjT (DUF2867 family)